MSLESVPCGLWQSLHAMRPSMMGWCEGFGSCERIWRWHEMQVSYSSCRSVVAYGPSVGFGFFSAMVEPRAGSAVQAVAVAAGDVLLAVRARIPERQVAVALVAAAADPRFALGRLRPCCRSPGSRRRPCRRPRLRARRVAVAALAVGTLQVARLAVLRSQIAFDVQSHGRSCRFFLSRSVARGPLRDRDAGDAQQPDIREQQGQRVARRPPASASPLHRDSP